MLNNGAMIANRYRLQRLIATGGMGQVWEAVDTRLDRRVAVKVLKAEFSADPTFRHRFRTEAKTTAQLNHPGIAGVYDYGETLDQAGGETAYLVMELVQGEPLNAVLSRMGRLSVSQGLDMLEQTGRALEVAHAAGVVHRDVKPGNILVTPTGQVKITDFGIAKAVDASPVTKTGMVMGTAQYIAPEQATGSDATSASDVYSLGAVGYEALSGHRPFTGDGALTVAMKHVREALPPMPADLPTTVRELIEITMTKDPNYRYRSGGEFADAVAAVRAGHRPPAPIGSDDGAMSGSTRVLPGAGTRALHTDYDDYGDYDDYTADDTRWQPSGRHAAPSRDATALLSGDRRSTPPSLRPQYRPPRSGNGIKVLLAVVVGVLLLGAVAWVLLSGSAPKAPQQPNNPPTVFTSPTTTTTTTTTTTEDTTTAVAPPVTTTAPDTTTTTTTEPPAPTTPTRIPPGTPTRPRRTTPPGGRNNPLNPFGIPSFPGIPLALSSLGDPPVAPSPTSPNPGPIVPTDSSQGQP